MIEPYRDALGLVLAQLDRDDERLAAMIAPYRLDAHGLELVVGLLDVITLAGRPEELRAMVTTLALDGAGRG